MVWECRRMLRAIEGLIGLSRLALLLMPDAFDIPRIKAVGVKCVSSGDVTCRLLKFFFHDQHPRQLRMGCPQGWDPT